MENKRRDRGKIKGTGERHHPLVAPGWSSLSCLFGGTVLFSAPTAMATINGPPKRTCLPIATTKLILCMIWLRIAYLGVVANQIIAFRQSSFLQVVRKSRLARRARRRDGDRDLRTSRWHLRTDHKHACNRFCSRTTGFLPFQPTVISSLSLLPRCLALACLPSLPAL
jgi:hypothetical protein